MASAARKFQPGLKATIVTLAMLAVLMALGCWQVQRLAWKTALLEKIAAPAVALPAKIDDPAAWECRHVRVTGWFLSTHEFPIGPRTENGVSGYHLFAPLRRWQGDVVFINRGFTKDGKLPDVNGRVTIEGVARLPEKGIFTPENDSARDIWYWPDIAAMSAAAQVKNVTPVLVYADAYPPALRNDHRQYAIFWFGMAAVLLIIYVAYGFREKS